MTHTPILLNNVSHSFAEKLCFEPFTTSILPGSKIGIIGKNGSGKSTLLNIIQKRREPSRGTVHIRDGIIFGHVPQMVTEHSTLSGSERFNKVLSKVLATDPDILCLDEPTNHLDVKNRASLMRMLKQFKGTLLVASHDVELLRSCIQEIWLIENQKIMCFSGNYDEYKRGYQLIQEAIQEKHEQLIKDKKHMQHALAYEQQRVARSKHAHKDENDRKLRGKMRQTASQTEGKNKGKIYKELEGIHHDLANIHIAKEIKPTFTLSPQDCSPHKTIASVSNGSCGYDTLILDDIQFQIRGGERVALLGDNGSGKTTLIKALMQDARTQRTGDWHTPSLENIGYVDQHYATLNMHDTVLDAVHTVAPHWTTQEIRKHLNSFLFSKNEQVHSEVAWLSGGERARLSLAIIAAQSPKLLILDEITNNVDLETREHIINVLKAYPGAMIIISHDKDFLEALSVDTVYCVENKTVKMYI